MKKLQRILAILGVVLLLALYASTMIFALSGSENSIGWFKGKCPVWCSYRRLSLCGNLRGIQGKQIPRG